MTKTHSFYDFLEQLNKLNISQVNVKLHLIFSVKNSVLFVKLFSIKIKFSAI